MNEQVEPQQQLSMIADIIASPNLVPNLAKLETSDERHPDRIAAKVIDEYQIDVDSRSDWLKRMREAIDMAMLVSEEKNYPFQGSANVKYPLLVVAALQFNARAYPAIVQGNRVVKCVTWGDDKDGMKSKRADRVSEHLSHDLLVTMKEWEEDTDKLLLMLPILGCMFRKVYRDESLGRKITRLVPPQKLVMNYYARSVEDVPRLTEEMELYPYEIQRRIRDGRFIKFDYGTDSGRDTEEKEKSGSRGDDTSEPHLFLEQHLMLDLDNDGMDEPYVATVHKATRRLCKLVANFDEDSVKVDMQSGEITAIERDQYFIKYLFLPSPDGGAYGWGFGALLSDIQEAVNTTINEMLDAGHLANTQGGFVSAGLGIREKNISLERGEYRVIQTNVPLNQAIYDVKFDGPAPTLFQLLGLLIESGRDIAAIKDVLTGEVRQNMTAAATLALIEQGLQVFTAIFKRIHRSLKAELGLHAKLNKESLTPEEYNTLFDGQEMYDPAQDYNEDDMDILPVSDPNVSSRMLELSKAEYIWEKGIGNPVVNQAALFWRVMEAVQTEDIDELLQPPPQPDPEIELMHRLAAKLELQDKEADIVKKYTESLDRLSSADDREEGKNINKSRLLLDILKAEVDNETKREIEQRRLQAMERRQPNPGNPGTAG